MYRQGDVLIVPVTEMPGRLEPVAREDGRVVLAHGEATGHAHTIRDRSAALFCVPELNTVFLTVSGDEPAALTHDEHATIMLPPGRYRVVRQREYAPEDVRYVAD